MVQLPTPSSTILEKKDSVSNDTVLPKIQSPSFTSTEEKPSAIPKNTSLSSPVVSAEKKVFIEEGETESILIDEDSSNTNRIKSFNFSPILSLEENEEQQTTEIKSKNQLIPPELTSPIIFHQLLKINWQDDAKQILKIKQSMEDVGFEVQKLTTSRKKKDIDKVYMHLTHPKGLDWRFTVKDFEQIELKIMLDNKIGLRAFAYRFNEKGDFSNLIQLTEKSVSKHRVSSGTKGRHITRKKKQD